MPSLEWSKLNHLQCCEPKIKGSKKTNEPKKSE